MSATSIDGWRDGSVALPLTDALDSGPGGSWLTLPPTGPARLLAPRAHLRTVLPSITQLVGHSSPVKRAAIAISARSLIYGGAALLPERRDWSTAASRLVGLARDVSGIPDAVAVIRLNPRRPNRKPVLQLLAPDDGRTLAYVKVGWDEISARLIRAEAAALRSLGPHPALHVPQVLGFADTALPALAVSALHETRAHTAQGPAALAAAAVDIFTPGAFGDEEERCSVQKSPLVQELRSRVAAARGSSFADQLATRFETFLARYGDDEVTSGRWHGDWAAGNVILGHPSVAWDWERSSAGAPLGLDAAYTLLVARHPAEATRTLVPMLAGHPNEGKAQALVALALVVRATRHSDAAAVGQNTRAEETLAMLDEALRA